MRGTNRDYGVLSLLGAVQGHEFFTVPHALISITAPWDSQAHLHPYTSRIEVLRLPFDEVRKREEATDVVFDTALARTVADFVLALHPDLRLVVHCYARGSR